MAAQRVLDQIEIGARRACTDASAQGVDLAAPAILRSIEEQILRGEAVRQLSSRSVSKAVETLEREGFSRAKTFERVEKPGLR